MSIAPLFLSLSLSPPSATPTPFVHVSRGTHKERYWARNAASSLFLWLTNLPLSLESQVSNPPEKPLHRIPPLQLRFYRQPGRAFTWDRSGGLNRKGKGQ
ncbi:hypothetical protein ACLOJK_013504 [Asimina triloba]